MNKMKYHGIMEDYNKLSRYLNPLENKRMREILFDNRYSFNQVKTDKQIDEITDEEEKELQELEEISVLKQLDIEIGKGLINRQVKQQEENNMSKSVYEKIKESQLSGTFEGNMLSQGKHIRYFPPDTKWLEVVKDMNQEEYDYYQPYIHSSLEEDGERIRKDEQKRICDFQQKLEQDIDFYVKKCLEKQKTFPQPNRIPEEKIRQDIKHLVGNPYTGDDSYLDRLKDYVGEVEQGNVPVVNVGDNISSVKTEEGNN